MLIQDKTSKKSGHKHAMQEAEFNATVANMITVLIVITIKTSRARDDGDDDHADGQDAGDKTVSD